MKPVTILLAEENLVTGLFVKRILQNAGYRVWLCMDASEAWQYYADKNPDLVLLDHAQKTEHNISLANKIRGVNKVIPIVFLSGKTFEEEVFAHEDPTTQQPEGISIPNEKTLLQNLHYLLPAVEPVESKAPVYDPAAMQLCSAEDILVLTTFLEEEIHLRQFVLN
jgi:CheY-like chemotaxis protein